MASKFQQTINPFNYLLKNLGNSSSANQFAQNLSSQAKPTKTYPFRFAPGGNLSQTGGDFQNPNMRGQGLFFNPTPMTPEQLSAIGYSNNMPASPFSAGRQRYFNPSLPMGQPAYTTNSYGGINSGAIPRPKPPTQNFTNINGQTYYSRGNDVYGSYTPEQLGTLTPEQLNAAYAFNAQYGMNHPGFTGLNIAPIFGGMNKPGPGVLQTPFTDIYDMYKSFTPEELKKISSAYYARIQKDLARRGSGIGRGIASLGAGAIGLGAGIPGFGAPGLLGGR